MPLRWRSRLWLLQGWRTSKAATEIRGCLTYGHSSHARTSRSTAGSVQREHQLSVAARLVSTRVLAGTLQALGARFGDEWAPARLAA